MQAASQQIRLDHARRELVLLLAASLACVVVLTVSLAHGSGASIAGFTAGRLLLLVLIAGGAATAVSLVWYTTGNARRLAERAQTEATGLRRSLLMVDAVIKSEPQTLVLWDQGQGLKVVTHTLSTVPGLPDAQPELLRFGRWLDPKSADQLKAGLDALFAEGRPFSLLLKTRDGGHLEADGRAAGTRAVLRLRDVANFKRDLVKVLEQQSQLSRDVRASRSLFDALPFPAWIRKADGAIQWVNKAYVDAVEAKDEAEVRERRLELLEARQRAGLARALTKGTSLVQRLPLLVGGERKTHDVIAVPLENATAAVAIDVAAIESARGQLDRLATAYDRTLDRVATAVAIFGPDQRLTFFNDAYRRLWQLDAEWLTSGPADGDILDRLRERSRLPAMVDYRQWKGNLLSCYETSTELEDWWHLPDGRTLHMLAEQRPDGGVTYLYDDATERIALESRYNALIAVQRETLDSLKEGVAVFATDGRLKLFNSSFMTIWKLSRKALAEEPHIEEIIRQVRVLYDDPRTWTSIAGAVTSILDEREPVAGQMLRPDQSVVDFAVAPLSDGATLLAFADVTATKRYERALVERNEALIAADRLKSQFIGHVSYELRTPLTNIIGFGELLANPRAGALNDKQREYLGDISTSSKTLLSIIDDILDLATIDAGALELKLAPVNVSSIIDAAILGVRERASRARLTFNIAIADDAVELIADESRVRQVLYNLLSNAIGFSRPGDTICITCRHEAGMMAFSVADQGVGIPKEQQRRIFERFESQSHGSRHRGAGLGLALVKSLVELHGGAMSLSSEPGRGTCVMVRLPARGIGQVGAVGAAAQA